MRHPLRPAPNTYFGQPVVLTRATFLAVIVVLGLLAGAGVVIGKIAVTRVANERSARSAGARAQLRRELELERAARRRGDELDRRLRRQESPTVRELERRIALIATLLRRHPELRRRLAELGLLAPVVVPSSPAREPRPPARGPRGAQRPPADRHRGGSSSPPSSGPGHPPASGPPPPSRPPVDVPGTVTTPAGTVTVPTVCIPGIGGVGCP